MSILIGALEFDGPIRDLQALEDISGLYAVLCENDGEYELIELGDSNHVREQIQTHEDRGEWIEHRLDIAVAVYYTDNLSARERLELKQELEREFEVEAAA